MKQRDYFDQDPLPDEVELKSAAFFFVAAAVLLVAAWLFGGAAAIPIGIVAIGALAFGIYRSIAARLGKNRNLE